MVYHYITLNVGVQALFTISGTGKVRVHNLRQLIRGVGRCAL
jgi:hypothetical protein